MKNPLTLAFLFLFFQISFSQDWALFPNGQKTYWEVDGKIHLYYNDVTLPGSFTNRHYFGAEYLTEDSAFQCYKHILENVYQLDEPPIDSIFSTPLYWFDFIGNDEIRFHHLAEPGEGWTNITSSISGVDSIIISCTEKIEETFFGKTDSVKIFKLQGYNNGNPISKYNDAEYKLSKSNGFIKFIPLRSLGGQITNYELMGFNDGQAHGFTSTWEDFFGKFEVGQILAWRYERERIYLPSGYWKAFEHFNDSITYVDFNDSYVKIGIFRKGTIDMWKNGNNDYLNFDSTGYYELTDTIYHYREYYETVMDTPPGWLKIDHSTGSVPFHYRAEFSWWGDPYYNYDNIHYSFDTTVCDILIGHPSPLTRTIMAGLGLTRWGITGGLYGEYYEYNLRGYKKNGEIFGTFYNIVNPVFSRPTPNLSFEIFPNPATNNLNVIFPEKIITQELELKIVDLTGKIILQKNIKNGFDKIDTHSFPAGVYFVVVNGNGIFGRKRFVKM